MRRLAWLAGLCTVAICTTSSAQEAAVRPGDLPPIAADYRASILAWARRFYADPHGIRRATISEPVLTRDTAGRLLWLVCVDADAKLRDGGYQGADRHAFGFAPSWMSAPLARAGARLTRDDCDRQPLRWRRWPELEKL